MIENLLFIPYQDSDDFLESGILTREYAILYMLNKNLSIKNVINIKKPRTELDKKRFSLNSELFPLGTIENSIKEIIEYSSTIQYNSIISINQILARRGWWKKGYKNTIKLISKLKLDYSKCAVYSDNPFAYPLIKFLHDSGAKVYFDAMDNFALHPSLNAHEHKIAYDGYASCSKFSDCFSVNSVQTQNYMKNNFEINALLIKNGVFPNNVSVNGVENINQYNILCSERIKYSKTIGYIGKIGKRIDEVLVNDIANNCKEFLFVFIGPYLNGQENERLLNLFKDSENILHLESVSSAYVLDLLKEFDVLMIPHAVGKSENGGDPLKLYQYLSADKPIITTGILGVDEFEGTICISNNTDEWIEFLNNPKKSNINNSITNFEWLVRFTPIIKIIKNW